MFRANFRLFPLTSLIEPPLPPPSTAVLENKLLSSKRCGSSRSIDRWRITGNWNSTARNRRLSFQMNSISPRIGIPYSQDTIPKNGIQNNYHWNLEIQNNFWGNKTKDWTLLFQSIHRRLLGETGIPSQFTYMVKICGFSEMQPKSPDQFTEGFPWKLKFLINPQRVITGHSAQEIKSEGVITRKFNFQSSHRTQSPGSQNFKSLHMEITLESFISNNWKFLKILLQGITVRILETGFSISVTSTSGNDHWRLDF
jgi:hypothetical protein